MNIYHNEPQRVTADPNPNRDARSFMDTNADTGELTLTFSDIADISLLLLLVCVSFTIIGQPRNSVLIRRV